jgi:chemotaxis protein MotB
MTTGAQELARVAEGGEPAQTAIVLEARLRSAVASKAARWADVETVEDEEHWATSYLDVLTLLITLFVVLLTRSTLDAEQVKVSEPVEVEVTAVAPPPVVVEEEAPEVKDSMADLRLEGLGGGVEVEAVKGGVLLKIPDKILFAPGRADLKKEGREVLDRLVPVLNARRTPIAVEGHTDDVPIKTARFPSNWELSSARASTVVRQLQSAGVAPSRLRAVGFGETRPVAGNHTPEGRAKNRRVVLVLSAVGR